MNYMDRRKGEGIRDIVIANRTQMKSKVKARIVTTSKTEGAQVEANLAEQLEDDANGVRRDDVHGCHRLLYPSSQHAV